MAIVDGSYIQTVTSLNCPLTRARAVDARDNHTYWVQKLADNKCWMLTNLSYAGDGINTYNDVTLTGDGSSGTLSGPDNSGVATTTLAKYYVPTDANPTTEPTSPAIDTSGGSISSSRQYGYLYNWCAAMGAQSNACVDTITAPPNTNLSICPAGWRLPTGNGGEFTALNNAVNGGLANTDVGLRNTWLVQYGGYWGAGTFRSVGSLARPVSSTFNTTNGLYVLRISASSVSDGGAADRAVGWSVRCIAV